MTLTFELLTCLADGKFHSGEALAKQFNVSRARVWQAVDELRTLGLEVAAVTGRGYKIFDGLELLDKEKIWAHLPQATQTQLADILIYPQISSTNSVLMEGLRKKTLASGTVCLAEHQLQGRGRLGREWISPVASNIYCSFGWQSHQGAGQLMGLSLVMGIAVARALTQMGASGIGLKWPNDIFWQGKKLGGILVEIAGDALGPCDVVIGVGLNVLMPVNQLIDRPLVDLNTVMQRRVSRNQLAAYLIASIDDYLQRFATQSLQDLLPEWLSYDIFMHKTIRLTVDKKDCTAQVVGIDAHGQLQVLIDNQIQTLTSAHTYDMEINYDKMSL